MKKMLICIFLMLFIFGCTKANDQLVEQDSVPINEPTEQKNEISIPQNEQKTVPSEINQNISSNATSMENKTVNVKPSEPAIVNGKSLDQRLQEASDRLHTSKSGELLRSDFPDLELVYTDNAKGTGFPGEILPFRYYYSKEADITFNICNIELTVFICKGKLNRLIDKEDIDNENCEVTPVYTNDPRLGGSGDFNY